MHKHVAYFAYGWLIVTGAMHFVVDVVLQYLRLTIHLEPNRFSWKRHQ